MPQDASLQACIDQLWVYPIKSCAGVSLDHATLTHAGLAWDRAWMVVNALGHMVTQRDCPRMVLIQPALSPVALQVHAPGMPELSLPLAVTGPTRQVHVWNDPVPSFDMGEAAAQWFTRFLLPPDLAHQVPGPLRLVRFDSRNVRASSAKWTQGHTSSNQFSDGFPVLLASTASLEALNARLARQGQSPVDMRRFRPNVVLRGISPDGLLPHDEDRVGEVTVRTQDGEVRLLPVKPCPRCPIPNIDPQTALSNPLVSDTLQMYRQDARVNGAVTFGMNALPVAGTGQVLRVGQSVTASWAF